MKKFVTGIIVGVFISTSITAFAASEQLINAVFGKVKLVVDGNPVAKETLLYNGTTYVPLRAAAEALGKSVNYDAASSTAYNGSSENTAASGVSSGGLVYKPVVENTTEATTEAKMSLSEYQQEKQQIELIYKQNKEREETDLKLLEQDYQKLQAAYKASSYTNKIEELQDEAELYSRAGTNAGQEHYKSLIDQLEQYKAMQASLDADYEQGKILYESKKKQIQNNLDTIKSTYDKDMAEIESKWKAQ